MTGEYPYCGTGSFTDELKRAAFEAIYKDGCHDCGDWIDTLVNCYSEEVMDALGNNPNEVYAELEDIWENVDYEDPRTIIRKSKCSRILKRKVHFTKRKV